MPIPEGVSGGLDRPRRSDQLEVVVVHIREKWRNFGGAREGR
jgi:hypothetical protein